LIRIEVGSGVPITRQIMDQIRAHCGSGALRKGDRLPSVRELARQLAVNHNTIQRAYERLTAEGVLELRHGDGTYVGELAAGKHREREIELLAREAERFVRRGLTLGVKAEEIARIIEEALVRLAKEQVSAGERNE